MKIVSVGYSKTAEFSDPVKWLERISFYTGLLEELAKENQVGSIECINYEGEYEKAGVRYYFTRRAKKSNRLIKKFRPDVVFVNGFIFPLQILQLRWKLGKKVKIIVLHRAERPFTGIKRFLQKLAGKYVDAYLFASDEFGKDWKGIIDEQKIYEIIQASSAFRPTDKNKAKQLLRVNGSPVFLWVGRLNKNKDPLTLIRAFKQYLAVQPQALLYMIYQSDELLNECRELIGVNENIRMAGKVEHRQLENWYNAADFFISSSHREGSGIAVSEAMSCGCIPVLTNIASFRRMTGPGKCGLLFEAGNTTDLLKTLVRTSELNKEAEKEKVLEQFKKELSFEAIAKKINAVINALNSVKK